MIIIFIIIAFGQFATKIINKSAQTKRREIEINLTDHLIPNDLLESIERNSIKVLLVPRTKRHFKASKTRNKKRKKDESINV